MATLGFSNKDNVNRILPFYFDTHFVYGLKIQIMTIISNITLNEKYRYIINNTINATYNHMYFFAVYPFNDFYKNAICINQSPLILHSVFENFTHK